MILGEGALMRKIISFIVLILISFSVDAAFSEDNSTNIAPFKIGAYGVYTKLADGELVTGVISTNYAELAFLRSAVIDKSKPVIVFIHGNSALKEAFIKQFTPELLDNYNLIAFDLPGHGQSSNAINPETTYSFKGYAHAIAAGLANMSIKKAIFVGWSLGGHVAIELMERHKELTSGIIITGTPPIPMGDGGLKGFREFKGAEMMGQKKQFTEDESKFFHSLGGLPEFQPFTDAGVRTDGNARFYMWNSIMDLTGGVDQEKAFKTSNVPKAIIYGINDKGINNEFILNSSLDYNNLAFIMGLQTGHATFWDNPKAFNHAITMFVDSIIE
jgi:pimeloyl-ACP methyl ester carboxylesterase